MMTAAERIATALEVIAASVEDPEEALITRVDDLEQIVREFISLMKNPQSTNEAWDELLQDALTTLGVDEGVTS